jgi:dTDP-4-dehydrorhamnose 3,5-epimerase
VSRLTISETSLDNLCVLERNPIIDNRGFLERVFCINELERFLDGKIIRQVNHTLTKGEGVVRGMHFQYPPYCEQKIVSCMRGEVYDVAIDLRKNSPTFLKYYGAVLSADNFRSLYIPEGFAHGFQTLSPECEMLYFHTADYHAPAEGGINSLDPAISINWPLKISELSPRDRAHAFLDSSYSGVDLHELS